MLRKERAGKLLLYSGTALRGGGTLALGVALLAGAAQANPQGGQVNAGAASIQSQGSTLAIRQHSDRAVIDWQSFDISPTETTVFHQPSASSAVLNRIHDQDPSRIEGSLRANGQVFLVNPNGMVFGKGARVNVGSLVATSADISNSSFMQGGALRFDRPGNPHAVIQNGGNITAREAGLVALVAPQVSNSGYISAKLGKVALASGDTAVLDLYGDGLVSVAASEALQSQAVTQAGTIRAQGGEILLQAAQAKQAIDGVVNLTGITDASSAVSEGGGIVLTGDTVRIGADALVDASGGTGGGEILVGGDYLGQGDMPHARRVRVAQSARIHADAMDKGDGGRVILWSDEHTDFHGRISAKGGVQGGNGGFIETSSKNALSLSGRVDASAPRGSGGQWLLDPNNVTIQAAGPDTNVTASPNFSTTNDTAIVTTGSIETALNGGTSVTVATTSSGANTQSGDITLNDPISKTAGGNATLTLQADNSIFINDPITSTSGALGVVLHADKDNSGAGSVTVTNATINTNGGNLTIGGGVDPLLNPARGTAANINGVRIANSTITTGTGSISIRGLGGSAGSLNDGILILNGSVLQTTIGNVTLIGTGGNGTNTNRGVAVGGGAVNTVTSASGIISITGQGGNGTANNNYGIDIANGSSVVSTGTGVNAATIALNGTGGNGTTGNYGVRITSAGTLLTSVDGDISITGTGGNGSSTDNYGIYVVAGADITSVGIGADAATITLNGTGGNGTSANFGVSISDAGTLMTSVDGDISITGTGGNGSSSNYGIYVLSDADIISTGTGNDAATITLNGTGGNGTAANYGMRLNNTGTLVTSVDGDILLIGQGGGDGTSSSNRGIYLSAGVDVTSTGTGADAAAITMTGMGGNGTSANEGVRMETAGTLLTSVDGDISITGQGGNGSTTDNYGIYVLSDADIISTGIGADAATITLNGTGGTGTTNIYGIRLNDTGTLVTSVDGDILLIGQGGNGSGSTNYGIFLTSDADITSTGTGADAATITLNGTGGNGTSNNYGVILNAVGTLLTSVDGDISITGTGGNGSSNENNGIYVLSDADITSTGTGADAATITLNGTGGNGTSNNRGVYLNGAGTLLTSVDGDISITGQGDGDGSAGGNYGIYLNSDADITSTGMGADAAMITLIA